MKRKFGALALTFLIPMAAGFAAQPAQGCDYSATLVLDRQIPSVVETGASGHVCFQINGNGAELEYTVAVDNIEKPYMAHIHLASPGQYGLMTAWLYPSATPLPPLPRSIDSMTENKVTLNGRHNGVLVAGTITADDLVGPLAGASIDSLLEELKQGRAYVNVHTAQNKPGELRGQVQ